MISEIIKFASIIVGMSDLRPYFMEYSSVLCGIVRARKQENDGQQPFTLDNIDQSFLSWLSRKGFNGDDIKDLERAGGGIVQGLVILLRCLARRVEHKPHKRDKELSEGREIQWHGWKKLDAWRIGEVERVYQSVSERQQYKTAKDEVHHAKRHKSDMRLQEDTISRILSDQVFGQSNDDGEENDDADSDDIEWGAQKAFALLHGNIAADEQAPVSAIPSLKKGNSTNHHSMKRLSKVSSWSQEMGTDLVYSYQIGGGTEWNIKLCFVQIPVPVSAGIVPGQLSIKIEIADEGQTHPKLFATDAQLGDIARRIAFRLRGKNSRSEVVEYYPSRAGYATVAKTNTLGDKVIFGDEAVAISRRPRRFLFLDPPGRSWAPNLQRFVGGSYTSEC
ncbi:hypothetical protein NLG97_g1403 [Lecanicillium saksenae]|uniref:Uncharacterized protein n=1 Tax=Lecanicillium saksenae TaxID=468837 RepID=A0ACC1R6I3_9HYPO|nr:hypothetical protein NLG97_g1403 [Lecanicillium saksenae]